MTDEELKAIKEEADRLREENQVLAKERDEERKRREEVENEEKLINWRKARKANENMKKKIEASGFELDEETGEVKERAREISPDDIRKIASEESERILIAKTVAKAQRDMTAEDKATFERFYAKATHGETVTSDNVEEFIELAYTLAGKGMPSRKEAERASATRGGAPVYAQKDGGFADTEAGQEVLKKMLGQ